jgi:hypothetical protein
MTSPYFNSLSGNDGKIEGAKFTRRHRKSSPTLLGALMAKPTTDPRRRRFIKLTATGFVVTPFANALLSRNAEAADMVKESDPAALKLKYRADATKARERKDPAAVCDNCTLYTGKPDSTYGACAALDNKLVAAKGWCTAWESY